MSVNDLPVGRCVEETLRLVKAFQFVETHGEVCPASWTPDSPTVRTQLTYSRYSATALHKLKTLLQYCFMCLSDQAHP